MAQQLQQAQIQQQLVALANSPYGDSPLFRDVKLVSIFVTKLLIIFYDSVLLSIHKSYHSDLFLQDDKKREDVLKPTNPAAQKAALAGTSQYKVSPRPTAKIKPKPIQSLVNGKVWMEADFSGTIINKTTNCMIL